jgi:nitrous oxide reductase accessory protein NosL
MRRPTRRALLHSGGVVAVGALAGCFAGDDAEDSPEPVDLEGRECDICGMTIGDHYGPSAQVFYEGDHLPDDSDRPAWFDSIGESIDYLERQERRGYGKLAMYVVDYSQVDYRIYEHDVPRISTHTDADAFVDVHEVTFVVESDVHGAMGGDSIPFSNSEDAAAFADEHGGETLEFDSLVDNEL